MTPAMLDTNVIAYAFAETSLDPELARRQRSAKALVTSLADVRVSSIVVLELLKAPPEMVERFRTSGVFEMIHVELVDGAISMVAADILEMARNKPHICSLCLNVVGASTCKQCGQQVSHQQKTHDALVVATAAVLLDVDTLYSYDGGVLELGKFVKDIKDLTVNNLTVKPPPSVDGPLFDAKRPKVDD